MALLVTPRVLTNRSQLLDRVVLQTPESEPPFQVREKDIAAVGRKGGRHAKREEWTTQRHGRIVRQRVVCIDAVAASTIPDATVAIGRGTDKPGTIRAEFQTGDCVGVSVDCPQESA